ncbi:potassium channel family protein [Paracrocinitomix mangrovi]|uniref:potassium channel family protein n=1 Tax=Paracrocinitomix mangrovi TaxID=2862509 RepID=UPI001C8D324E|nr:potassium channel family protein [Paracrocinitomix mangrovi]UKN02523.1 potassium channel family protein [Paracrocinitomix mangrovi]
MGEIFYEIEILDESIELDGKKYNRSVRVVEFYAQKKITERYLAYVDVETIYNDIDGGHSIDLNNCYVKDFSLAEYRRKRKLDPKEIITIHGWNAPYAFFDCDAYTDFSYSKFDKDVSFDHAVFSHGSLNFTHTIFETADVDFSDCSFHSHQSIFQYAEFKCDKINFENSNFNGELVSFINASIKAETVNFKRVNFNRCKVKFHFAEFGDGSKTFEKIKFNGPVLDFRRVIFGAGKLDFRRSLFGSGHISFEESEISSGKLTFRLSKFEGGDLSFRRMNFGPDEANFDDTSFGCRNISFESCTAGKLSISNSDIHSTVDLRVKKAEEIDLSQTYLHSITDLSFQKAESLDKLCLTGARNLGKIIIDWNKNNVRDLILNQNASDADTAEQFNIIKDNFTKNGQYTDEDWAYVYFKRFQLKDNRQKSMEKYKVKPLVAALYFAKSLIFDRMGLFATSPNRVFVSMVVAIVGFAGIYVMNHFLGIGEIINTVDAKDGLDVFDKSLYHSSITFFTIGYGDYYPTSWNRLVSAVEGWVGVFLMSYFTVAFVRKILR